MIAAAPITTTIAPSTVSAFSYSSHRGVMRLSMTFDCWKKSCHGATVVPTMAMISSTALDENPPWMLGTTKPCKAAAGSGWLRTTSGSTNRLAKRKTNIARSQRRKFPVTVMEIRTRAATGTTMYGLKPTENHPQKRPNRSMISLACPTPVTAPSRTTISWLTIRTGIKRTSVHSSE